MTPEGNGGAGRDVRIVMGIIASLFIAMTLGAFGIIWARQNQADIAQANHARLLSERGERITKIESTVEYLRLAVEAHTFDQRRLIEDMFQVKLMLQQRTGPQKSPP